MGVIEDYKPLDVECAAVSLALLAEVRARYPDWRLLVDGDGGDENLKDYPIEENSELTIRSVVNNRMLYQEGWGVDSIKHSLTYSGGYSRGCVRGYACAAAVRLRGFQSVHAPVGHRRRRSDPVRRADARARTSGCTRSRARSSRAAFRQVLGMTMPIFPKRRFQHGSVSAVDVDRVFSGDETRYRRHFESLFAA